MFIKIAITLLLVGYAAAACNMQTMQAKCGKFLTMIKEVAEAKKTDIDKLCCLVYEQVSCIEDLSGDCGDNPQIVQILSGAQSQIKGICGSYEHKKGCLEPKTEQKAKVEKKVSNKTNPESKDDNGGAHSNLVASFSLVASLCVLLRLYN